jgi:hypothetical protein
MVGETLLYGRVALSRVTNYFTPETAKGPFELLQGQVLWVEVTVPPSAAEGGENMVKWAV